MANGFESLQMICIAMALISIIAFAAGRYWYYEGDAEADRDFYEDDEDYIKHAENMIINNCNKIRDCRSCRMYMQDEEMCKYTYYEPWQWKDVG